MVLMTNFLCKRPKKKRAKEKKRRQEERKRKWITFLTSKMLKQVNRSLQHHKQVVRKEVLSYQVSIHLLACLLT